MTINYKIIKKIHLYACLSTAAVLLMFIVTSYLMIHHSWFDHEASKETRTFELAEAPASEADWNDWATRQGISGRLVRTQTNASGDPVREYAHAGGQSRVTFLSGQR